jgi:hypothetical protein
VLTYDGSRVLRAGTAGHTAVVLKLEPPRCLVRVSGTTGHPTRYTVRLDFTVDVTDLPPLGP